MTYPITECNSQTSDIEDVSFKSKKVCFFVGSRANYGRLIHMIKTFKASYTFCVYIIGANTLAKVEHDLRLDMYVDADMHTDNPSNRATTIGLITIQVGQWLANKKMDLAICHGDRFETLGFAIATHMNNIPLVHLESGEISNVDNDVRWAISQLSTYHMCPTYASYIRMLAQGKSKPYFVGSPIVDYIKNKRLNFREEKHVLVLYNPVGREEFLEFGKVIALMLEKYPNIKFNWVNPNIDPGNKEIVSYIKTLAEYKNLEFKVNLELNEFLDELNNSICFVGNSSSGIKEAYVLGVPYIMYGDRQGNREIFDNVVRAKDSKSLILSVDIEIKMFSYDGLRRVVYQDELGKGDCSDKVLGILEKESVNESRNKQDSGDNSC